jgi:hypothetical protein
MKVNILLIAFSLVALTSSAQAPKQMRYDNFIYEEAIKTVLLYKGGGNDPYPVITLGSAETLQLSFDELKTNNDYYQYTWIHCNSKWEPTNLSQNEYLTGMNMDNINDIRFSTNALTRYVHYNVFLPNENMRPRLAGNYIIKVFRNYDENDIVITRRCYVLNPKVTVSATVRPATLAQHRYTKQEIDFEINYKGYFIPQPYQDLKVTLLQNNRLDNAITDLKPQFMTNEVLQYNYEQGNLFEGGNEFRWFDIRSLRGVSPNVRSKTRDTVYHCLLSIDESRASKVYMNWIDFNGRRVIDNKDLGNSDVTGDYAWVNFYLSSMSKMAEGDVYLFGEFTDWQIQEQYKMRYNKSKMRYETDLLLKQGRYEYIYVVPDENNKPNETPLEGAHFETENDYLIMVYHRNQQFNFDELIGMSMVNSGVLKR